MIIDLHIHTTASDGTYSPDDIIKHALKNNIRIISITDHDTIAAYNHISYIPKKLKLITGVEISTDLYSNLHILGYGIDLLNHKLKSILKYLQGYRKIRNREMVQRFQDNSLLISREELGKEAQGEMIGKVHFARILLKKGYVNSLSEAFNKYLIKGTKTYVSRKKITPEEAIKTILDANGIPTLAHPSKIELNKSDLDKLVDKLKGFGLKGIEAFYSYHLTGNTKFLLNLAEKYHLVISGGSDFHGENKPDIKLGIDMPEEFLRKFLKEKNF